MAGQKCEFMVKRWGSIQLLEDTMSWQGQSPMRLSSSAASPTPIEQVIAAESGVIPEGGLFSKPAIVEEPQASKGADD